MADQVQGETGGLSVQGMPAWQFARRQRIVEAALAALEAQDYEQIQIRDVAASAGVALGTLYRYFSSKEHLYAAVLQEWAAFGRRSRRSQRTPEARVRARVHAVIRAFEHQPQFFKVHVLLQASSDLNAKALLAEFHSSAHDLLTQEFEALGPGEDADAAIILWSIINTMVTQAIYQDGTMADVHRLADRFIDLVAPQLAGPLP